MTKISIIIPILNMSDPTWSSSSLLDDLIGDVYCLIGPALLTIFLHFQFFLTHAEVLFQNIFFYYFLLFFIFFDFFYSELTLLYLFSSSLSFSKFGKG